MIIGIILCFYIGIVSGFEVYWNVPTIQCSKYQMDFFNLLKNYGIRVNTGDKFQGDNVTIFYEPRLGLYPRILKSGKEENGGIPQKGDLTKHLNKAAEDLEKAIPLDAFDGLGVIDWEAWRPTWEFNWKPLDIYQRKSIELAKEEYPTANASVIQETAKHQWEQSAKLYIIKTLQLVKKMRPHARWGYYLFPDCYNYNGNDPKDFQCSANIRKGNDKLSWLWKESNALCPSIYVHESHLDRYTFEERTWRDNEKLREALRISSHKAKIFPYVNYFNKKLIPEKEVWRMLAQAAAIGSDGAVVWGSSASVGSKNYCNDLKKYIISTLGPAAEMVSWRSDLCSKEICNNRGRCRFPNDNYANAWKFYVDDSRQSFDARDITCRCSEYYSGRFCNETI